jgi:hypothetical protein
MRSTAHPAANTNQHMIEALLRGTTSHFHIIGKELGASLYF